MAAKSQHTLSFVPLDSTGNLIFFLQQLQAEHTVAKLLCQQSHTPLLLCTPLISLKQQEPTVPLIYTFSNTSPFGVPVHAAFLPPAWMVWECSTQLSLWE